MDFLLQQNPVFLLSALGRLLPDKQKLFQILCRLHRILQNLKNSVLRMPPSELLQLSAGIERLRDEICDFRGRLLLQSQRYELIFQPWPTVVKARVPDNGKRCRHIHAVPQLFQKRFFFVAVVEQTDQLQCAVLYACTLLQKVVDSRQCPPRKDGFQFDQAVILFLD